MDGARLFNAAVALGVPASRIVRGFDTASFCLSKGLGAPVGSLLCGSKAVIRDALRVRKMLGGGMRQAGILAAAGLYALDHHVDSLADDHRRARRLAEGLTALGYPCEMPETNMVYARVPEAEAMVERLERRGVLALALSGDRVRFVTHLDVDDEGIERAVEGAGG
jgi:threonine aldolase